MKGHPTKEIKRMASSQPGGVIRWRDAQAVYLRESESARRDNRRGSYNFHMNMKRIFKRYFKKVEGVNGFYVLKSMADESAYNQEP